MYVFIIMVAHPPLPPSPLFCEWLIGRMYPLTNLDDWTRHLLLDMTMEW
jgi:hypothetical protein